MSSYVSSVRKLSPSPPPSPKSVPQTPNPSKTPLNRRPLPNPSHLSSSTKKYPQSTANMNDQDNFELKMRIFYLEEKLSRLCSPPSPSSSSVHPVKDDASRMLGDKEDTIRVMEEELNRSNREVESLRGRLSATEDELLQLSDSLDSHRTSSSSLSSRLTTALTQNATLKEEIKAAREKIDRSLVEREITGQTGELLNSYR